MKKLNIYFLLAGLLSMSLTSCLVDDSVISDSYGEGPNLVSFTDESIILGAETNGEEFQRGIPVDIIGPTYDEIQEPVTVEISVDPSSTAIEGVHYRLESTTMTISPGDDLPKDLPITIITDGLEAPLDETPVLNLTITEISSDANVVINGKNEELAVNLAYACPFNISDYAGTYIATTDQFGIYSGDPVPFEVVAGPGDNQITLQNVAGHSPGYDVVVDVDPNTGNLTIPKQVAFNYNNLGGTQYGDLSWEGSGTSSASPGNCIGNLDITSAYTVNAGSFGSFRIIFEKVQEEGTDSNEDTDTEEEEEAEGEGEGEGEGEDTTE
ncbi:hypothetical protein [Autumnicola musiva]|uniref:DUF1735 domain-containing protein n=1 Tax=Autumnicola musiva TaxID=3075589 RepID=A0ABU3D3Q0_9FLAO|nr:hypothetical protein [Zunongwangia sp. F117]MDT0675648.1 hypothetical protein [Zunongwangia sp. F117]